MKRIIVALLLFIPFVGFSQVRHTQRRQPSRYKHTGQATVIKKDQVQKSANGSDYVSSLGSYEAYANKPHARYEIADPTIKALNERAEGYNVRIGKSGVVGMPKHEYGFADGHIIFHSSNSTTSGTSTGSGAVGTGSSPGSLGSSGPGTGLNGKSPNAGTGVFGFGAPQRTILPEKHPVLKKQ